MKKANCMKSENVLSKYLLSGAAVGVLALSPFAAQAQDMTTNNTMATTTMSASEEPMLVTGTIENYWVDRSGFVSAMTVRTDGGVQTIRFSPTKAQMLTSEYEVGEQISVWVTPNMMNGRAMSGVWNARGVGMDRPTVWMPVNTTSDFDWLSSLAYVLPGGREVRVMGKLRGIVTDPRGDVLALSLDTNNGRALVRVPAELRQIARGHIGGSERVASLIKGSDIDVTGNLEAPRGGLVSTYGWRVAANTISVNGKNAGAIGIQMLPARQRRALIGFDIGGINSDMKDGNATNMGYMIYNSSDMAAMPMMDGSMNNGNAMSMTTQTATGRVMIVTANGETLPVVRKSGRVWAMMADGSMTEIMKTDGKYMVPASMTGSRMQMVMSDGSRMEMDTVDGQLMVVMADGTMAPVKLHTP